LPALFSLASTPEAHSPLARFAALRALQSRLETPDESFEKKQAKKGSARMGEHPGCLK
jgi:hypothetical protein